MIATYPVAVTNGHNRAGGEAFASFVQSPPAEDILARWGFIKPSLSLRLPVSLSVQSDAVV